MSLPLANVRASTPNLTGMKDMDAPTSDFENPVVHGADTGGAGGAGALAWRSRHVSGPGRVAGLASWNRSTAVNFNAGSQFKTAPPISGG